MKNQDAKSDKPRFYTISDKLKSLLGFVLPNAAMAATVGFISPMGHFISPVLIGAVAIYNGAVYYMDDMKRSKFYKSCVDKYNVRSKTSHKLPDDTLKEIKSLYKKLGVNPESYPIYNLQLTRPDEKISDEQKRWLYRSINQLTAVNIGSFSTQVAIFPDLIDILDAKEVKAALAHEFAHKQAKHNKVSTVVKLLSSSAVVTNGVNMAFEFCKIGFVPMIGSAVAYIIPELFFSKNYSTDTKNKTEQFKNYMKSKKRDMVLEVVGEALTVSIASIFNPAVGAFWGVQKALNVSVDLVYAKGSRMQEYHADKKMVENFGGDPLALVTTLRKVNFISDEANLELGWHSLQKKGLSKVWKDLHLKHPSTDQRTERLSKMVEKQGYSKEEIDQAVRGPLQFKDPEVVKKIIKNLVNN